MNKRAATSASWRPVALRVLVIMVMMIAAVGAAAVVVLRTSPADEETLLPSFVAVRQTHVPSDIQVYDRAGVLIGEVRQDYSERRGQWISLASVSPAMRQAVLVSEDRRFYEHAGVDWLAVAAAAGGLVFGDGRRGASTISMQLAAMLDTSLRRSSGGRGLTQKWAQMRRAIQLEAQWSKDEILEAYLNLVAFRGELRGVDAMARVMFQKRPHGLSRREAVVAAALLRGPNAPAHIVASRACGLLSSGGAQSEGAVPREREVRSGNEALAGPGPAAACRGLEQDIERWLARTAESAADAPDFATHFSRYVVARHGNRAAHGGRLETPLDARIQAAAQRSVARHLSAMQATQLTDAAVVVLDNHNGDVLAYVGASLDSSAGEVDHVRARRQAGSTLKPFLYAMALEGRYLTAASLLNDAPLDVATPGGLYIPANYDSSYAGWVSVRVALASSLNIPAVRTLMLLGPERFAQRLRDLGLPLVHDGDHYGYSLSLGSADVDLLSLANAYRSLARGESRATPVSLLRTPSAADAAGSVESNSSETSVTALAAWVVGDILSDRQARARTFGLENALSTRYWSAVKTGTSKDMRDNWAVGWSSDYTVAVWVGNSQGLSMRDVSGVSGAAPIWNEVMSALHAGRGSRQPPPPPELDRRSVEFEGLLEAARTEYFLPGTAMARVRPAVAARSSGRIIAPADGTVIAIDPDMPPRVQRLVLKAVPGDESADASWFIGERAAGSGTMAYWAPVPGKHTIELRNRDGRLLDKVDIVVKGLPRHGRGAASNAASTVYRATPRSVYPVGPEIAASSSD